MWGSFQKDIDRPKQATVPELVLFQRGTLLQQRVRELEWEGGRGRGGLPRHGR